MDKPSSNRPCFGAAFLLLGFAEEFVYRGYSQTTLAEGMGFWRAAVWMALAWDSSVLVFHVAAHGTLWFAIGFHAMPDYADMVLFAVEHGE